MQITTAKRFEKAKGCYLVYQDGNSAPVVTPRIFKFTKALIDQLLLQADGQRHYHDQELTGFSLTVGMKTKTFYARAYVGENRDRRIKIGLYGVLTLNEAREKARRAIQELRDGVYKSPKERRAENLAETVAIPQCQSLQKAFAEYLQIRSLKPNTKKDYQSLVERSFQPWLSLPVDQITKRMVMEMHSRNKKRFGPSYADYGMKVLSAVIKYIAEIHHGIDGRPLILENPVAVLTRTKAWTRLRRRETLIKENDLIWFFKALNALRTLHPGISNYSIVLDYLELVICTGLRRNEAASLGWKDIDFVQKTLRVEETKNGETHVLPLTEHLIDLLKRRETEAEMLQSDFVFPSIARPKINIKEPRYVADTVIGVMNRLKQECFGRVLEEHEKCKFTIHDLRRNFATAANSVGIPHTTLKRLMNHKLGNDITEGYQIITVQSLRDPMEKISAYFRKYHPLETQLI